jgi:NAD(P)-dependent dehydrogenase (short-subunit alcohol dehydrogenase family)
VVSRQWSAALDHFEGAAPSAIFLNAGIGGGRHALEAFDIERFDAIFRVNTRGRHALWFKQALPALKAQPETSQIVVTSSVAALRGVPQGDP